MCYRLLQGVSRCATGYYRVSHGVLQATTRCLCVTGYYMMSLCYRLLQGVSRSATGYYEVSVCYRLYYRMSVCYRLLQGVYMLQAAAERLCATGCAPLLQLLWQVPWRKSTTALYPHHYIRLGQTGGVPMYPPPSPPHVLPAFPPQDTASSSPRNPNL